jgi:GAF domain-containing protein
MLGSGAAMSRRDKTGAKAGGARRRKAPKSRNANRSVQKSSIATVERVRLARVTRERDEALEQQTATAEILKVISQSAFSLQAVLEALVSSAVRLCDADTGIIRRREGDIYPVAATFGFTEEERDHFVRYSVKPDSGSVFGRAILERRSIHVPDLLADRNINQNRVRDYATAVTIRSGLGVPLLRDGKPIGVFTLQRRKRRPYTRKQIELAETFANQAVIAIENTWLFQEVQAKTRDLEETLQQQTATSEVLQVVSSSPGDLEPVFNKMLETATRVCGARFGTMTLFEGGHFRTVAVYEVPQDYVAHLQPSWQPHPESGLGRLARTLTTIQIADLRLQPPYLEGDPAAVALADLAKARTIVLAPMLKHGSLVGALAIFDQEVRPFSSKQVELLENFAKQAVIAV